MDTPRAHGAASWTRPATDVPAGRRRGGAVTADHRVSFPAGHRPGAAFSRFRDACRHLIDSRGAFSAGPGGVALKARKCERVTSNVTCGSILERLTCALFPRPGTSCASACRPWQQVLAGHRRVGPRRQGAPKVKELCGRLVCQTCACCVVPVYLDPFSPPSARYPPRVHYTKTSVVDRQDGAIALQPNVLSTSTAQRGLDSMNSKVEGSAQLLVGDNVDSGGGEGDDAPPVGRSGVGLSRSQTLRTAFTMTVRMVNGRK